MASHPPQVPLVMQNISDQVATKYSQNEPNIHPCRQDSNGSPQYLVSARKPRLMEASNIPPSLLTESSTSFSPQSYHSYNQRFTAPSQNLLNAGIDYALEANVPLFANLSSSSLRNSAAGTHSRTQEDESGRLKYVFLSPEIYVRGLFSRLF